MADITDTVTRLVTDLRNEQNRLTNAMEENLRLNVQVNSLTTQNNELQNLVLRMQQRLDLLENRIQEATQNQNEVQQENGRVEQNNINRQASTTTQTSNNSNNHINTNRIQRASNESLGSQNNRNNEIMQESYNNSIRYERPTATVKTLFKFSGKANENIDDWFFSMELYFEQTLMHPEDKLNFSIGWLRENARSTYINQMDTIQNWSDLKRTLIKRFKKNNFILRKELDALKQTSSIQDYIFEFERITNQLKEELNEKEKMFHFTKGLHFRTQEKVEIRNPKTLQDLMNEAIRLDCYDSIKHSKINRYKVDNSTIKNDRYEDDQSDKCWYCKDKYYKGHVCLNKTNSDTESESQSDYETAYSSISDTNRLIKIDAFINNVKIACVVDCGSTRSIISRSIVNKLKIPISNRKIKLKMANGFVNYYKQTKHIPLDVLNQHCNASFVITNINEADVLLGLDWLNYHDVIIHPARKKIEFASKPKLLNHNETARKKPPNNPKPSKNQHSRKNNGRVNSLKNNTKPFQQTMNQTVN